MTKETRAKAKKAQQSAHDLYRLLDELQKELSTHSDFAGYVLAREVQDHLFGRKSTVEALTMLSAISTMGEKE